MAEKSNKDQDSPPNPIDPEKNEPEINPWGSDLIGESDYVRLCSEFGIQQIADIDIPASIYEKNRFFRRKIIFGHRDLQLIIKAVQDNKPWAVMSGIKPSGHFHLGTFTTASEIVEFQKMGGKVYYAIADLESYADNGTPLEIAYKNAVDNLADILTIGLDPKNAYVWLQSREPFARDMPFKAGRHVTNAMLKAIYGDRIFALYMTALVQVGDILLPQLKDFIMPTVVPVGIDQDPHIRLTRDLSRHFTKDDQTIFKPGATYHKLLPGLDDITQKMSKSRPNSYFNFDDEPKLIKHKLSNAFTGGRGNKEDQERLGGIPENCMIYKIMEYHFEPEDAALFDRYKRCRGGMLCGICKKEAIQKILDYVADHNVRKKEMLPIAIDLLSQK
jgi:tryptophanyl-tRNA synthetase